MSLKVPSSLVSVEWLYRNLADKDLVILNATLPKVAANNKAALQENQIKKAIFFDIKKTFSDVNAQFPNTVLPAKEFEVEAQKLGVNTTSCIVVYDEHGIYSSPRAWWLFKTMGFDNVAVLDGGLPAWKKAEFPTVLKEQTQKTLGDFKAKYRAHLFKDYKQVLENIQSQQQLVIDARSSARFTAEELEPRPEVKNGHIPNSKNLPFTKVLTDGHLASKSKLQTTFKEFVSKDKALIFSCGTGITACILALAATVAGYDKTSVYDGSWTEWGSLPDLPTEK
ncbi:sulfurtransferase [Polaribacter pacificus]|uniref:Sulfurtransferase n=1 Tax=Polaribacter pacificus TaxID=1775173 RepID=A0A917MDT8_9FLAO|nr:sulfurtransferase [Polaribacter pacificus]GGG99991.1 sulfurtransferase [Polaribacter pacificus]